MKSRLLSLLVLLTGTLSMMGQKPNIAPNATVSGDGTGGGGCRSGACSVINDQNLGTCGTQQMWISTSNPPSSTIGDDFIEWDWPNAVSFDEMTIHHGNANRRTLTGFIVQSYNGSQWVSEDTVSNLPQQCTNNFMIKRVTTDRMRITAFEMTASGQTSNPNFREIEIFQASTSTNDAGVASTPPTAASCPGSVPIQVTIQNFGTNVIDSVDVAWSINGTAQPTFSYNQTLDTIGGTGNATAQVTLGNFNFTTGVNYNLVAYTLNPNGVADTSTFNDTLRATLSLGPPSNLAAINPQTRSIDVDFDFTPGSSYEILYGPTGFNPTTAGQVATPSSTPSTVSGLSPSLTYDFYVYEVCSPGVYSDTAGPVSNTTLIQGPTGVNCVTGQPGAVLFDGFESVGNWTGDIGTTSGEWNYNSGGTSSSSTGPSGAHSGNQYLYVETSGGAPYTATIVSPAIDLSTSSDSAELSFWLHAYGATIGTLDVGVGTSPTGPFTTVFTQNGQLQSSESDPFQNVGVRLDSYVGQTIYLQFDYTSGNSFTGDIAIDELEVTSCQTCPFPSQLVLDSISSDAALISWNGSGSDYQVNWGPAGFTQGSSSSSFDSTTTNGILVDSLAGNTSYDIYLRTNCSDSGDGFSGWIGPLNFVTECNPFSAPYFTNFDNSVLGEVPLCWSEYIVGDDAEIITDDDDPFSSPNHMFLDNDSQFSNDTVVAVSPRFSDMTAGDKRVRFWVRAEFATNSVDLWVGTMSGPDNGASLNVLDTIVVQGNTNYFEVSVNLDSANGYNGTDQYVALVHDNSNSFDGILVDDFTYETIPACQGPQSTQTGVSSVTSSLANIFWGGGQGDTTKIVWGTPGFTPATGPIGTGFVSGSDSTFTITGLAPQTTYEFYLQDSCASSGAGLYIGPFSFTTACLPLTAPVTEDFENTTNWSSSTIDPCWSRSNASGHAWEINSGTTGSSSTGPAGDNTTGSGQYIYTETSSSSPNVTTLVTPLVDVSGLNVPFLEFYYHRYGSDMGDLDVEVNDGSGWTNVVSYTGEDQTSSSDPWQQVGIDISAFGDTVAVRFVSTRGSSFRGDGALDDVSFIEAPACPDPTGLSASGVLTNEALISWNSNATSTGYQVWFGPTGFFQGTQATGGTRVLVSGGSTDSLLLDTLAASSCYDVVFRSICAPGDTSDWVGPITFCTQCTSFNLPFVQNFDGNTWVADDQDFSASGSQIGNCWSRMPDNGNDYSWRVRSTSTGSGATGPDSDATGANFVYAEASNGGSGDTAALISPVVNLGNALNPRLIYGYHFYGGDIDRMFVEVYDGSSWNLENTRVGEDQTSSNAAFKYDTVDLSSYSGNIQVRFRSVSAGCCSGDLALDSVVIDGDIACPKPTSVMATQMGCDSLTLSWTSNSGGSFIQYGPAGFTPGQGNFTGIVTSPHTITGLSPGTAYDFWVADTCTNDTSVYAGPYTDTTANAPQPMASFIDSTRIVGGVFFLYLDASASMNADTYQWNFGNGSTGSGMMDTIGYNNNGTYTVSLVVSNACGADTLTDTVNVNIGLAENPLQANLSIFPNPTDGIVQVEAGQVGDQVLLRLTDMRGSLILRESEQVNAGTYRKQLDISALPKGIYMLEVETQGLKARRRINLR
jgi:hypothetical protein